MLEEVGHYKIPAFKDDTVQVGEAPMRKTKQGHFYDGQWSADKNLRHGKGVTVWNDGAIYEGHWKFDMANGKG